MTPFLMIGTSCRSRGLRESIRRVALVAKINEEDRLQPIEIQNGHGPGERHENPWTPTP